MFDVRYNQNDIKTMNQKIEIEKDFHISKKILFNLSLSSFAVLFLDGVRQIATK